MSRGGSYSYDLIGRLTGQGDTFSTTSDNVSWAFTLNPASQITSEARTETTNRYAFGPINTASKAYAVNGLNQYTTVAGAAQTYDANGSLTGDGTNTYIYDGENRRLVRLNYLAPDIVAAILDGTQPEELKGGKLMATELPMDWSLQRRLLGFPDQPDYLKAAPGW